MQPHTLANFFLENLVGYEQNLRKNEAKLGQILLDLDKFWVKSRSCIRKTNRSPTAMLILSNLVQ